MSGNLRRNLHRNVGNKAKSSYASFVICLESVKDYLRNIEKNYGEMHATLFVWNNCGFELKKEEEETVHLPTSMSKINLYEKWCFRRGYKIRSDAKGRYEKLENYCLRENHPVLCPEGTVPDPVCSWYGFRNIWKKHFGYMKIRSRSEDVCDECFVYRNKFKYRAYDGCKAVTNEFWQDSSDSGSFGIDGGDSVLLRPSSNVEENEMILVAAAEHVKKEKIQREYSNKVSSHQSLLQK